MKKLASKSVKLFLFVNVMLFTCIGIIAGIIINLLMQDPLSIFLCASYSGFFLGFLGGIIYLFRNDLA